MTLDNETTTQEPTVPTTETPEVVTPPEAGASETQEQQPQFVPNFKFKYTGKNGDKWGDAEGEIDEPVRALIKSKADEEKWQKLYSKAHGFEFVQDGRERARTELKQYQEQVTPIMDLAKKANKAYQAGDVDGFLEALGVPKSAIQKYVLEDLQRQELQKSNPDQFRTIEENRSLQKRLMTHEERLADFEEKNLQLQSQMIHNELNTAFSQPEVATFKNMFDSNNGQGAFENEVRMRGKHIHDTTGRITSPGEVVQEIIKKYSFAQPSQVNNPPPPATQQPATLATQKPTIPVVQSGGQSPSGKVPKTAADLRKIYEEKYGAST